MVNPIVAKLAEIAPDYTVTKGQAASIARAADPQKVADWLPDRVQDVRNDAARYLGCSPDIIPLHAAIGAIENLSYAIKGKAGSDKKQAEGLGAKALFEIGRATMADPEIVAAYADVLERYPDRDGHAFWLFHKNGGMPMETIRRMMAGEKT